MAYTTIDDPSAYFQIATWSGDNATTQNITNDGNSDLQPDWVWVKCRNTAGNGFDHTVWDTSRGVDNNVNKSLSTSQPDFEGLGDNVTTTAQLGGVSAMLSDGFTVREGSVDDDSRYVNENTRTYVAWQWKCNGGTETASSTEGSGALTSSAQANTTAKFSIVTYTGSGTSGHTFVHGLGSVPKWIILKSRSDSDVWHTFHQDAYRGGGYNQWQTITKLNLTNASDHGANAAWSDTAATSSVVTVGNGDPCNEDGDEFVAYCWDEVQGYSKFGFYKGTGRDDGPFIYTGFKPAWMMLRRTDNARPWFIFDNKRSPRNVMKIRLKADSDAADDTSNDNRIDFVSNGFKIRDDALEMAADGGSYIYIAFAEHPFVSSKGVPVTAR